MAERRSLIEGLKATPAIDPEVERKFVYGNRAPVNSTPATPKPSASVSAIPRVALSSRMRTDLAHALKRASLQRQLDKVEPNSLTEILEAAIEPWLRTNGYLD